MNSLPPSIERTAPPTPQRFEGLADAKVTAKRKLYLSEYILANAQEKNALTQPHWLDAAKRKPGGGGTYFFLTVDGQTPTLYYPDEPPVITTTIGAVEDWTIENHTTEIHAFHMHQIHYMLLAVNGVPVPPFSLPHPRSRGCWHDG
jgi:hypothetical protein